MGLDQYAMVRKTNTWNKREYNYEWRKHARLHEFMNKLWHDKGNDDEFNCQDLELTMDDILNLEIQVNNGYQDYESDGGFFWGHQFQVEQVADYEEQDMDFVNKAKEALRENDLEQDGVVVYTCWW